VNTTGDAGVVRDARARRLDGLLFGSRGGPRAALAACAIRVVSGSIFLVFGVYKFTDHAHETDSFETYGLPSPSLFAYGIGVIEVLGGVLLLLGLLSRMAAVLLAGDMIGAIATAGRVEGGAINLVLAPALLLAMGILLWIGPGRWALDGRLARSRTWSSSRFSASPP
jgi:putative oxidoreductase